jgi:putative oxidoreductase
LHREIETRVSTLAFCFFGFPASPVTISLCSFQRSAARFSVPQLKGFPEMFRRIISTSSSWAAIPIRLALAAVFIFHGSQKVLGTFGGPGINTFVHQGAAPFSFMRPAWLWWGAAAFGELLGGIMVLLGLLTRVGAFLLAFTMVVAISAFLWPAGFDITKGGYEFAMALLAMSLALLISGGGMASIDRGLSSRGGGRRR